MLLWQAEGAMVRIALRIAVVAAAALTSGCYYYPYGYAYPYRYAYPAYGYARPLAPVVVYGGGYRPY